LKTCILNGIPYLDVESAPVILLLLDAVGLGVVVQFDYFGEEVMDQLCHHAAVSEIASDILLGSG
jgi:hypothetical protein